MIEQTKKVILFLTVAIRLNWSVLAQTMNWVLDADVNSIDTK